METANLFRERGAENSKRVVDEGDAMRLEIIIGAIVRERGWKGPNISGSVVPISRNTCCHAAPAAVHRDSVSKNDGLRRNDTAAPSSSADRPSMQVVILSDATESATCTQLSVTCRRPNRLAVPNLPGKHGNHSSLPVIRQ
jgi:hypothetical protein